MIDTNVRVYGQIDGAFNCCRVVTFHVKTKKTTIEAENHGEGDATSHLIDELAPKPAVHRQEPRPHADTGSDGTCLLEKSSWAHEISSPSLKNPRDRNDSNN